MHYVFYVTDKFNFFYKERHEDICNNTEVDCPNKCGEKAKRKSLNEHYKVCKMKLIQIISNILTVN